MYFGKLKTIVKNPVKIVAFELNKHYFKSIKSKVDVTVTRSA